MIIGLVLVSAFLHALWNALLRLEADRDRALVAAVGTATLLAILVAALRWAHGDVPFATVSSVAWALVAGVLELTYFIALARALAGPLGPVYTISRGGAVLVVWPLSIALYGEPLLLPALIGSAVVFAGLALSGGTGKVTRGPLAWAITCALAIAGYHLAYKAALRDGGSPSAVFAVSLGLATAINLARLGRAGRTACAVILRTRRLRVMCMGLVCGGSFLILMEALASGGAGFVLTLRNTSVLFATALAWVIGERPGMLPIAGSVLVAAGAVLMALS